MMKKLLVILLFIAPVAALAQDMKEYKAANGKTYHVGDTVKIALGSTADGNFKYVQVSQPGFLPPRRESNGVNARKDVAHTNAIIKRIKTGSVLANTANRIIFVVKTGGLMNYDIWIEEAVAACEVTPCASATPAAQSLAPISVADELAKLKKLLDSGALTQAEYDAQKKKLLAL